MALLSIFRGTQAECSARPVSDGTLLFATDTKKIYLDKDSSRIEMSSVDDLSDYITKEQLTTALNGKANTTHTHSNYLTTTGTAAAASKLATARTISLAGDVTGSANFDGSANISITSNIAAGTVGANELANSAVTNAKIAADSVSLAKLSSDVGTVAVQSKQPSDTNVRLWIQI